MSIHLHNCILCNGSMLYLSLYCTILIVIIIVLLIYEIGLQDKSNYYVKSVTRGKISILEGHGPLN
jgi:hypothetical protein